MPVLYTFLWNSNPDLFDPNSGWWAKPAEEVMYICSEYYRYLKYMEKEEEDYKRDLEEYEQALKEYESEVERQKREEEENTNDMFRMAFNQKQAKDTKKRAKTQAPIKKPVNKMYA